MTLRASMGAAKDVLLASTMGLASPGNRYEQVGGGCYRTGWLDRETQTIYKVDHGAYGSGTGGNRDEIRNLAACEGQLPLVDSEGRTVRLPEWDAFLIGDRYVVAMEYCPDAAYITGDTADLIAAWFGLTDVGHENVRYSADGRDVVVTDLGLSSSKVKQQRMKALKEHADCDGCYHDGPAREANQDLPVKQYAWDAA